MIKLRPREQQYFDLLADGWSKIAACEEMDISGRHADSLTYAARKRNGFGGETRLLIYSWRMQRAGYPLDWWDEYAAIRPKLVKVGDMV